MTKKVLIPSAQHRRFPNRTFDDMPNPTPDMLDDDPLFDAIWSIIRTWDVNIPEYYSGYCGANGSHATLIYNAIKEVLGEVIDKEVEEDEQQEICSGNSNP